MYALRATGYGTDNHGVSVVAVSLFAALKSFDWMPSFFEMCDIVTESETLGQVPCIIS